MHYDSMRAMRLFIKEFLDKDKKLKILEVGSAVDTNLKPKYENMYYRRYFIDNPNWDFTGLDIIPGKNVDIVSEPYNFPFADNEFDVVISGSTLEHVEDTHRWIREVARVTKGIVFILVPNTCIEHRHPVDCWRVFPDGMRFLLKDIAKLNVIRCEKFGGNGRKDTVGIATKGGENEYLVKGN